MSKKYWLCLLALIFTLTFGGCNNEVTPDIPPNDKTLYSAAEMQVYHIDHKENTVVVTNETMEYLLSLWNDAEWENDNTKTISEYIFDFGTEIGYSVDGIFNDKENKCHLRITQDQKNYINSLLDVLILDNGQGGDIHRITLENANKIKGGMKYSKIVEILGSGGKEVGSGAIIYEWQISDTEDKQCLRVWFLGSSFADGEIPSNLVADKVMIAKYDNTENGGGEAPLTTIASYNEYLSFINSKNLPKNFVDFEKIAQFGEFKSIVFLSEARYGNYSSYMYNITDSIGENFVIYINHKTDELSTEDTSSIITNINTNDMRTTVDSKSGTFAQSDLRYNYVQGKLLTVSWRVNDVNYTIMGNTNNNSLSLSEYPANSNTMVGKLLSVKSAADVLAYVAQNNVAK